MSFHVLAKFIVEYAEMLQLLGDFVPQTSYRAPPLAVSRPNKISSLPSEVW